MRDLKTIIEGLFLGIGMLLFAIVATAMYNYRVWIVLLIVYYGVKSYLYNRV